ncbi:MAG: type VI secretion system contractile sheath small subunit [Bacteroidota bacterium]
MPPKKDGGYTKAKKANAGINGTAKSACVALPVPNPPRKPEPIKAKNMNEALAGLSLKFSINPRAMDGSVAKEELEIKDMGDFEEAQILQQSETLAQQHLRRQFLHELSDQLENNPSFAAEMTELLQNPERKEEMIAFFKKWLSTLSSGSESQLRNFLIPN